MNTEKPSIKVAVVMRKARVTGAASRWQTWRWTLDEVLLQQPGLGDGPRRLLQTEDEERWLFPGYLVTLLPTDGEGYYLNVTTDKPAWFVMWRMEEEAGLADEPLARPQAVSLSYHDAGHWMEAEENVDQHPAPREVVEWLAEYTQAHYVPEPKKRKRPESFKPLADRFGNPASVSTDKKRGPGHG